MMQKTGKWLIILTGVYDLLIGMAVMATAPATTAAEREYWVDLVTIGGCLMFCGAILLWAAQDLYTRGSAVAWQGILRLLAVGAIFFAIRQGYAAPDKTSAMEGAAYIDLASAIVYFVILLGVFRWSIAALMFGRKHPGAGR